MTMPGVCHCVPSPLLVRCVFLVLTHHSPRRLPQVPPSHAKQPRHAPQQQQRRQLRQQTRWPRRDTTLAQVCPVLLCLWWWRRLPVPRTHPRHLRFLPRRLAHAADRRLPRRWRWRSLPSAAGTPPLPSAHLLHRCWCWCWCWCWCSGRRRGAAGRRTRLAGRRQAPRGQRLGAGAGPVPGARGQRRGAVSVGGRPGCRGAPHLVRKRRAASQTAC